jgi:hypothetical protein
MLINSQHRLPESIFLVPAWRRSFDLSGLNTFTSAGSARFHIPLSTNRIVLLKEHRFESVLHG